MMSSTTVMSLEEQLYQELCNAAQAGKLDVVEALIATGAPLNLKDPPGTLRRMTTPVEHAIDASNLDLVSLLAHHGADLTFAGALKRAAHKIVQAALYDRDGTLAMRVFERLAQAGATWRASDDAASEDHMRARWREGMIQEHPALLEQLENIVAVAGAQTRKTHLEDTLDAKQAATAPATARTPRF